MCPCAWTRPSSSLPTIHAHQLRLAIILQRNHTIDFAVGMLMILPAIRLLGVHVDGRDAEVAGQGTGERDLGAPVLGAVNGYSCAPAFIVGEGLTN